MKIWEIEDKIVYSALFIGLVLLIYSQWGYGKAWLWDVSYILLIITLSCGLVCMLVFALLYPAERKKNERLEQEIRKLQIQLGKEDFIA